MQVISKVIESTCCTENFEAKPYTTYGLMFFHTDSVNPVAIVNDISCNKKLISNFCDLINRNNLDELHINDVIEDFLLTIL